MIHPDFKFFRATGMMIGAIIGVGVFGIPYAFAKSGVVIGFLELIVLGFMMMILQFMFAEVALQTKGKHRLVGYVELYLGRVWKYVAVAAVCASSWGALLAYMIIGGSFLHLLVGSVFGGTVAMYSFIIAIITSVLIYSGLKQASRLEVFVILSMLFLFVFMILLSAPHVQMANLQTVHWKNVFLPYGIILFALSSVGIVPEMKEVLGSRARSHLGQTILIGMITVLALYILFSVSIVGVTGEHTTPVAFDGLIPLFGNAFRYVTALLGTLTIVSISVMLGIQLMNTFHVDFHFSRKIAWALTVFVPIALFVFGFREFVNLIGFVGSLFGGLLGILIVAMYLRLKQKDVCRSHHCLNFPNTLSWVVLFVFLLGIIFKLFQFLL